MAGEVEGDEPTRAGTQRWPDQPPSDQDSPTYRTHGDDRATGSAPIPGPPPEVEPPAVVDPLDSSPPASVPVQAPSKPNRTPLYVSLGATVVIAIAAMSLLFGRGGSTSTSAPVTTEVPATSQPAPATTRPVSVDTPTVPPATVAPPGTRPNPRTPTTVVPVTTNPPPEEFGDVLITDSSEAISVKVPEAWTASVLSATDIASFEELAEFGLPITALAIGTSFEQINATDEARDYRTSGVVIFTFRRSDLPERQLDDMLDTNIAADLEFCEEGSTKKPLAVTPAGTGKSQLLVNCDGLTSRVHVVVIHPDDPNVVTTVVIQIANVKDFGGIGSVMSSLTVDAARVPELSFE